MLDKPKQQHGVHVRQWQPWEWGLCLLVLFAAFTRVSASADNESNALVARQNAPRHHQQPLPSQQQQQGRRQLGEPTSYDEWVAQASAENRKYSISRVDGLGSAMHDMLFAHAYCFQHNITYAGICIRKRGAWQLIIDNMLGWLGWNETFFPHHCPPTFAEEQQNAYIDKHFFFPSTSIYRAQDSALFTPEWLSYVKNEMLDSKVGRYVHPTFHSSKLDLEINMPSNNEEGIGNRQKNSVTTIEINHHNSTGSLADTCSKVTRVALHVRRGDVSVCGHRYATQRYLTVAHYRRILERYVIPHHCRMDIFVYSTQASSMEPWDEKITLINTSNTELLRDKQIRLFYRFERDASIIDVWAGLMAADVLVTSRSSFSMVPSILNFRATQVVYTPFWHQPLAHWTSLREEDMEQNEQEVAELFKLCRAKEEEATLSRL